MAVDVRITPIHRINDITYLRNREEIIFGRQYRSISFGEDNLLILYFLSLSIVVVFSLYFLSLSLLWKIPKKTQTHTHTLKKRCLEVKDTRSTKSEDLCSFFSLIYFFFIGKTNEIFLFLLKKRSLGSHARIHLSWLCISRYSSPFSHHFIRKKKEKKKEN